MVTWKQLNGSTAPVYALCKSEQGDWLAGTHDGLWYMDGDTMIQIGLAGVPLTAVAAARRAWLVGAPDGIARSDNRGAKWNMASTEAVQVSQIALSPVFNKYGVAYATTLGRGVMRSMDIGISWAPCNQGLPKESAYAIYVSDEFEKDSRLLIGTDSGVYRSNNGGTNWERTPMPEHALPAISFAASYQSIWANSDSAGAFRTK